MQLQYSGGGGGGGGGYNLGTVCTMRSGMCKGTLPGLDRLDKRGSALLPERVICHPGGDGGELISPYARYNVREDIEDQSNQSIP